MTKKPGGYIRPRYNKQNEISYYQVCLLISYEEVNGRKRPKYAYYKAASEDEAKEMLLTKQFEQLLQPKHISQSSNMQIGTFIDTEFLPHFVYGVLKQSSCRAYRDHVKYIKHYIGNVRLRDLTTVQLQSMYKNLLIASPLSGNPLSFRTVQDVKRLVSVILNTAIGCGYISTNVNDGVKLRRPANEVTKKKDIYTKEEMAIILKHVKGTDVELLVMLAYDSAMRRGELAGLQFSDFCMEEGYVNVSRNVTQGLESECVVTSPKTKNSVRKIYLSSDTMELVRKAHLEYKKQKLQMGDAFIDSDRLFRSQKTSKPLNPHSLYTKFKRAIQDLPVPSLRLHSLRSTSVTHSLAAGANVKAISAKCGHRNVLITQNIYEKNSDDTDRQASNVMSNIISEVINM